MRRDYLRSTVALQSIFVRLTASRSPKTVILPLWVAVFIRINLSTTFGIMVKFQVRKSYPLLFPSESLISYQLLGHVHAPG